MRYLSLDIETSSLTPSNGQILSIGAVIVDTETDYFANNLPAFYKEVCLEKGLQGEPIAIKINKDLITRNLVREDNKVQVEDEEALLLEFGLFIKNYFGEDKVTVAGKNVQGFDIPFIKDKLGLYGLDFYNFHHRVLDIGSLFYLPSDTNIPDLKTCLQRAGITKEIAHNALEDAVDVVECEMYHRVKNNKK